MAKSKLATVNKPNEGSSIYKRPKPSYEPPMSRQAWFNAAEVLFVVAFVGCGPRAAKPRADGTYLFDCSDHKACLERAKRTCGEQGYIVVGGQSNKKKYGSPGNEVYIGKDEMYIRCNRDRPKDAPIPETGDWSLRRNESTTTVGTAKTVSVPKSTSAPDRVCRPGETQRCFGPAACEGGQACLTDGSAFGPCDCGTRPQGAKVNDTGSSDNTVSSDAGVVGVAPAQ
jgi:hypothetical protein